MRMLLVLVMVFVSIGLISVAFASDVEPAGEIKFFDIDGGEIASYLVSRVEIEDLNGYARYLDNIALAIWEVQKYPTFYVGAIPENAIFLEWKRGNTTIRWVIIAGVQTELLSKVYAPAVAEAGLYPNDQCGESLLCEEVRSGW